MDVAALRALTDEELIRRHDAAAEAQGDSAAMRSTIYLDELRARVAEQQVQAMVRVLHALILLTFVVGVIGLITLVVVS